MTIDKLAYRPQLLSAMKSNGSLSQWMAVFYHEDPYQEFSETYSYERKLEEWVFNLGEIDQNQHTSTSDMEMPRKKQPQNTRRCALGYQRAKAKEHRWRIIFYGLCAVWVLVDWYAVLSVTGRDIYLQHPS